MYLWFRAFAVKEKYRSAVIISGLVTFIAAYHYIRIFNSWVDAYHYEKSGVPVLTGVPFNDAYRYMDWLLTVPLLLIEILLVMKLDEETFTKQAWLLGLTSALMIASGYLGELIVHGSLLWLRWVCWVVSMCFFLNIVKTLLVGLAEATEAEADDDIKIDQGIPVDDGYKLVHIPDCLFVPHAWDGGIIGGCEHSDRVLCIRHHLEVRCWHCYLSDHVCQVEQGRSAGLRSAK